MHGPLVRSRRFALAAGALLAWGAAHAAPVPEDQRVPLDLRRATIVVDDMERSLAFYRDALGMLVTYDNWVLRPRDAAAPDEAEIAWRLPYQPVPLIRAKEQRHRNGWRLDASI